MTRFGWSFSVFLLLAGCLSAEPVAEGTPGKQDLPGVVAEVETKKETDAPVDPATPRPGLNQFIGTIETVDHDDKVLRISVDTYNIEFTYNKATKVRENGKDLVIQDLHYKDKIVVRYVGRELTAVEIDRLFRGPFVPASSNL